MKKYLFLAAIVSAFTLSSCSNDDDLSTTGTNISGLTSNEIRFSTKDASNPISRASVNGAANVTSLYYFFVNAYHTLGVNTNLLFEGGEFWNTGSYYATEKAKYYWPSEGTVSFFAFNVWPSNLTHSSGITTLDYNNIDGTEDVVVAETSSLSKTDVVPLNFKHALSRIKLQVKGIEMKDGLTYKLHSVKLSGYVSGTLLHYPDGGHEWTNMKTKQILWDTEIWMEDPNAVPYEYPQEYCMIPCDNSINPDAKFIVEYEVYQNNVKIASFLGANAKTVSLGTYNWQEGKRYTYTLNIGKNVDSEIRFSTAFDTWDDNTTSTIKGV